MLLRDSTARRIWDQWEETLYPGFIKNLENVQGDERDRIIISTVYGPNTNGRVLQQFGPIVNRNGHRRLNVLFTRAKQRVDLYSSMAASDIRIDERSSLGLRAFHGYLDYAATLRLDSGSPSTREPDSEFEVYVADALRSAGYEAVPQVGAGGYFIDVGVRHPSYRHGFLAGIECDGAMYHSAKSAKDRDALRQGVLEDLGWTIYRVWSTDWFNDPQGETQKLVAFLEQLKDQKTQPPEIADELPSEAEVEQIVESDDDQVDSQVEAAIGVPEAERLGNSQDETDASAQQISGESDDVASEAIEMRPILSSPLLGRDTETRPQDGTVVGICSPYDHFEGTAGPDPRQARRSQVAEGLNRIIEVEGPMLAKRAYNIYLRGCGIQKLGHEIQRSMNRALQDLIQGGHVFVEDESDKGGLVYSIVRSAGTPPVTVRDRGSRVFEEIPPSELQLVATRMAEESGLELMTDAHLRAVLEFFNLKRLTVQVETTLLEILNRRYPYVDEIIQRGRE